MKARGLCTGDKFTLVEGTDQGLEFEAWDHTDHAICRGYPDLSTYGRAFTTGIDLDTEVYIIEDTTLSNEEQELRGAHARLKGFVATVKQGRTVHEVTGYAPTLDRAEEIIREEFRGMLGSTHRYIGVRWEG